MLYIQYIVPCVTEWNKIQRNKKSALYHFFSSGFWKKQWRIDSTWNFTLMWARKLLRPRISAPHCLHWYILTPLTSLMGFGPNFWPTNMKTKMSHGDWGSNNCCHFISWCPTETEPTFEIIMKFWPKTPQTWVEIGHANRVMGHFQNSWHSTSWCPENLSTKVRVESLSVFREVHKRQNKKTSWRIKKVKCTTFNFQQQKRVNSTTWLTVDSESTIRAALSELRPRTGNFGRRPSSPIRIAQAEPNRYSNQDQRLTRPEGPHLDLNRSLHPVVCHFQFRRKNWFCWKQMAKLTFFDTVSQLCKRATTAKQ